MGGKQHIVLGQVAGHAALNPRVKVCRRLNAHVGLIPKTDPAFRTCWFAHHVLKFLAVQPQSCVRSNLRLDHAVNWDLQA